MVDRVWVCESQSESISWMVFGVDDGVVRDSGCLVVLLLHNEEGTCGVRLALSWRLRFKGVYSSLLSEKVCWIEVVILWNVGEVQFTRLGFLALSVHQ